MKQNRWAKFLGVVHQNHQAQTIYALSMLVDKTYLEPICVKLSVDLNLIDSLSIFYLFYYMSDLPTNSQIKIGMTVLIESKSLSLALNLAIFF